jgi:SpoIID/LytB domain protein
VYEDKICDARFYKCCGGKTEKFENCWEPVPHPYLTSITDENETHTSFCDTHDKEILSQVLNDYDQETQDFYRWQLTYTQQEISELIHRKTGWDFGEIRNLIPVEIGDSGRIVRLKIVGTRMTKIIGKELFIRKALSESHLYSSAFTVTPCHTSPDAETALEVPSAFILDGLGWGHGVGLCQIGAAVMAAQGYDYQSILKHYFPGTGLKKLY